MEVSSEKDKTANAIKQSAADHLIQSGLIREVLPRVKASPGIQKVCIAHDGCGAD